MANKLDIWLAAFAITLLLGAGSSYRERALLSSDAGTDVGFLGRELQELDLVEDLSFDRSGAARFLPRLIRDAIGTPGSRRRNIPALASGQPLTSSLRGSPPADQVASGDPGGTGQLALANTPSGGVGGGSGAGQGGGIGAGPGPSLGGGGGTPGSTVSLLDPEQPSVILEPEVPAAPPLVGSAVPEPSVWMLFLLGLFFTGAVLRRRAPSAGPLQSV
jgi:hypothetical protein